MTPLQDSRPRDELCKLPATEIARAVRARELSPVEIIDAVLERAWDLNEDLNALCVMNPMALAEAVEAETAVMRGDDLGLLHGVPYTLKDLTPTKGLRTTFGSTMFAHHVPGEDAIVAERLRRAGGVLIGKTNTPEHGCKAVTDNAIFGPTRNPWDLTRSAGGSSGGAAAAVAAGIGPLAEGSDFAGSVRIPAAHCGVVGLKPSDGRVPIYPEPMPMHAVSFVHGPISRTVADAGLMLQVLAGPDSRDPRSLPCSGEDFSTVAGGDLSLRGRRIGWLGDLGFVPVEQEVRRLALRAVGVFERLGCSVEQVDTDFADAVEAYSVLNANRRGGILARFLPEHGAEMDPVLLQRIEFALARTAVDVARAEIVQGAVYARVRQLFEAFEYLALPTVPSAAIPLGLNFPASIDGVEVTSPFQIIPLTFLFNLTGHPAVSLPAGFTDQGLPVGLQIVGRWRADADLLKAAAAFEQAAPWEHHWPEIARSSGGPDS